MYKLLLFISLLSVNMLYSTLTVDDKSGMNSTTVKDVITLTPKQDINDLKEIIKNIEPGRKIIARGTRHSQGGHSIAQDGLIIDLSHWNKIEFIKQDIVRVQAGATWKEVLEYVNTRKKSVAIMQSDYDFSVGGTLSTNVHGWQVNKPPFIHSVEGFRILTAKGKERYCSRLINRDLFKAAIGGYGLFGIIISVDLKLKPNHVYRLNRHKVKNQDFPKFFKKYIKNNPKSEMFFARPRLDSENYMKHLMVRSYEYIGGKAVSKPLTKHPILVKLIRFIFERTQTSDLFRQLRWKLESSQTVSKLFNQLHRNALFYQSTEAYTNESELYNDLLQEYFVPEQHFGEFYSFLKEQKEDLQGALMNLTIRHVSEDNLTVLSYAKEPMFCFVMFFRGPKGKEFDAKIGGLARKIIDKAQSLGGTYYLPYRPYATKDQFTKAYPNHKIFKEIKLKYDPKEIFSNQFYQDYIK